ncbi:sensor histidine kinase [Anaerosporobacter sp.]|uniref:sensor histidine kinase n=1 Tax=Anaerosporobacter sp. TaxID=1872529 RepID=UPI00286EE7AE|nr:GHKL domain-containing protein [Anaerosporobacter sp.]
MAFATYMILKCSLIQLIYIPLAYLLIAFCNNTVEAAAMALLKVTSETLYQTLLPCLCVLLITTILAVLLAYLSKHFLKKAILLLQNQDYREMAILVCASIVLCTIVFLVNLYYIRAMSYPLKGMIATLGIFALYVVLTLALTLVMFRLFREKSRMRFEQEHQESLAEYTRQMEAMNEKLRSFKHDYTNILLSIYGFIQDRDIDGLTEHFQKEILPTNAALNQGNYRLSQLSHIQDKGIKGVLSSKLMQAHEHGIEVYIDILDEIRHIPLHTVDFSRILGIFLDNAMEATETCDTKRIELNLIQNPDSMVFTLRNTFQNTGVSLAQMRKRGFSTKGDSRGLGLANVRELLADYENVENITEIQGDFFVQQLVIQE